MTDEQDCNLSLISDKTNYPDPSYFCVFKTMNVPCSLINCTFDYMTYFILDAYMFIIISKHEISFANFIFPFVSQNLIHNAAWITGRVTVPISITGRVTVPISINSDHSLVRNTITVLLSSLGQTLLGYFWRPDSSFQC